jgi:hypothetical protein
VAVRPLRPATDRCLGGPLPRQLANRTRAHPQAPGLAVPGFVLSSKGERNYAVLAAVSRCCSPLEGRLPTRYSPVCRSTRGVAPPFALDLHVLGTPPALILSQDQTLQLNCFSTRDLLVLKALPLRKRFALSSFQGAVPRLGTRPEYRSSGGLVKRRPPTSDPAPWWVATTSDAGG